MRYPFRAGAAVVVLTVALAACGSSSDGHRNAGGAGASATRPPAVSPSNGPGATASSESAAPQASEPPKPTDELTPATGSFNKKQKEYLVDRVPKGMDPAAVLQTGQETCDRLTYLVKADREVAVAAIVTGELADAKPAVEHLCTQHRELVREAARGYADGTYRDKQLRPGRYHNVSPTGNCTWQITGVNGRNLGSGSAAAGKRAGITLPDAARTFTSTGCYAWLPEGEHG